MSCQTVVIVDDDKWLTNDLSDLFEYEGLKSVVMNSSEKLLNNMAALSQADCVILDIMMRWPNGRVDGEKHNETGEYLYGEIRNQYKDLPIIVLSAKDQKDIDINFNNRNTWFLQKPLDNDAGSLVNLIRKFCK